MIEGSKNGVNPIAEYFYSSMQVQLSNGVKVDVAYDIAYNNTEKTHGIGFIALKDFENNVKSYYAADIREDGKKYATDYYKDQLKTVETNKNTVNIDELNTINDYLINIGRPIRSAMVDYITTNENLLEEVYKKFGEKYRGHYHLVPVGKKGFKVEFENGLFEILLSVFGSSILVNHLIIFVDLKYIRFRSTKDTILIHTNSK